MIVRAWHGALAASGNSHAQRIMLEPGVSPGYPERSLHGAYKQRAKSKQKEI